MRATSGIAAALLGVAVLTAATAVAAQTAEPSMGCRLFPLACPGPVPAPPPPLLGTPEEQAAQEPAVAPVATKHHRRVRKHAASTTAQ